VVAVLGFNGWTQATRDPESVAVDAAWSVSQGRAVAVERIAPAVLAIRARNPLREESGTGVVVDSRGLVLTAHHVVAESTEIFVRDRNGRDYPAKIRGYDEAADLALLAIDAGDLVFQPARFGHSATARVGESVIALGSPFGLSQTATHGILSAKERTQVVADNVVPLLQTDAPINPGSSGGALINARGEMIGLINAILTRTGSSQGIGFAVPIDEIVRVLPYLRKGEPVARPWIGIRVRTGLGDGVEVLSVVEGGPGAEAGLQAGDRILTFGGQTVADSVAMRRILRSLTIGSSVEIEARRGPQTRLIRIPVASRQKKPNKSLKLVGR
jgi:S1-C subfamily serine protease